MSAVHMDFKPYVSLKPSTTFTQFLARLPDTYAEDPEMYQEFLDTFGTHYFESGMFGGYLLQQTFVEDNYRYRSTEAELSANLKASYQQVVSGNAGGNGGLNVTSASFREHSHTNYFYYGGTTNLVRMLNNEQFAAWSASVHKDPWLFGGRVKSVTKLIEKASLRNQMKTATQVKLAKAFLMELKRSLELIHREVPNTHEEIKKVDELLAKVTAPEADIKALNDKVEALVAQARDLKDRAFMRKTIDELHSLQHYELHCKKQVANICMHEIKHDLDATDHEVNNLINGMNALIGAKEHPDAEKVRVLVSRAADIIHIEQTVPIPECKEKLLCNTCKIFINDLIMRDPCDSTHIKKLLRVKMF